MSKIPIAIIGVGNCASSLVQGISFYGGTPRNGASVGLMHQQVGPYWPDDIEVVAAFDIDRRKVGIDVSEAIFAPPNCTKVFCSDDSTDWDHRQNGMRPRWRRLAHERIRSAPDLPAAGKRIDARAHHCGAS